MSWFARITASAGPARAERAASSIAEEAAGALMHGQTQPDWLAFSAAPWVVAPPQWLFAAAGALAAQRQGASVATRKDNARTTEKARALRPVIVERYEIKAGSASESLLAEQRYHSGHEIRLRALTLTPEQVEEYLAEVGATDTVGPVWKKSGQKSWRDHAGPWMLRVTRIVPSEAQPAEWDSAFTTLTVEVVAR